MNKLRSNDYLKIAKTALGAVISAAVAYFLKLDYAVSAGIICLLTIMDTRRETINVTVKRLISFCAVTLICCCFFGIFGYSLPVLGAVLAVFLLFCSFFGMNAASAMCSVIATHYFSSADCSLSMIINETLIFAAGAGTGMIMNLFMPDNIRRIRSIQQNTDDRIRRILARMSVYIINDDKTDYTGSCFEETSELLKTLKKESMIYIDNSFGGGKDYFLKYARMRMKQCEILSQIYGDIMRVDLITGHGEPISEFLISMSDEFHEMNNAEDLLRKIDGLFDHYSRLELPESRREFESRALMYHILCDLKYFVSIKADFVSQLTDKEKKRYWK